MRVDETYIDYSIIFLRRILIKINLKKDQRQRTVAQCGADSSLLDCLATIKLSFFFSSPLTSHPNGPLSQVLAPFRLLELYSVT